MKTLESATDVRGLRFAYADPPYIGQAKRHYAKHPDYAGEVDHKELVRRLCHDYDGWALSLSCKSLQSILALCPDGVRVLAWVKKGFNFLPNVRLQYGWEPVIIKLARQASHRAGANTVRDWIEVSPEGFTYRDKPDTHVIGKKPRAFCYWLFECLDLRPEDEFTDIYPGTGSVSQAWEAWRSNPKLFGRTSE